MQCGIDTCSDFGLDPVPPEGTFAVPVAVRAAEELTLDVSARVGVSDSPNCVTVPTLPNDPCLVPPYGGDAWVHVDPYLYVDPSWEYASWFEVQTSSDGVEWLPVKRTEVDLSTFGLEGGNGLPDGGVPDAGGIGGSGGATGTAGSGGTPGAGGGGGPSNSDGGGCTIVGVADSSGSHLVLLAVLVAAAVVRRRRTRRATHEL